MSDINSSIKDSKVRNLQMAVLSVGKGSQPEEDGVAEIKMQTKDLDFFYGKFKALAQINLSIQAKQITAIIGPSGCGKSTLLRAFNRMNDLVPHSRVEGKILLDNQDIYAPGVDVVDIRRRVGMVFQQPEDQIVGSTVEEDIAF